MVNTQPASRHDLWLHAPPDQSTPSPPEHDAILHLDRAHRHIDCSGYSRSAHQPQCRNILERGGGTGNISIPIGATIESHRRSGAEQLTQWIRVHVDGRPATMPDVPVRARHHHLPEPAAAPIPSPVCGSDGGRQIDLTRLRAFSPRRCPRATLRKLAPNGDQFWR